MASERILVLASSRKHGARCIAGLSLQRNQLVRPVSDTGSGELTKADCGLSAYPVEFDVVSFDHNGHDGDLTQPENLVVDGSAWIMEQPMAPAEALLLLEPLRHTDERLFGNRGKAVHVDDTAGGTSESLCIVEPDDAAFVLTPDYKTRVCFSHDGRQWDLGLTDYRIRTILSSQAPGGYLLDDLGFENPDRIMLLLSLGVPFGDFHHKLVAGVLQFP